MDIEDLTKRVIDLEEKAKQNEIFQSLSKINQKRLDEEVSKLLKKMDTQTLTIHKMKVEQFGIKRSLKQLDFAISQLPYLMVDELAEQELQKYFHSTALWEDFLFCELMLL